MLPYACVVPDTAADSFLEFAGSQPDQVEAGDYRKVGVQLSDKGALEAAVKVLDAGLKDTHLPNWKSAISTSAKAISSSTLWMLLLELSVSRKTMVSPRVSMLFADRVTWESFQNTTPTP